MPTFTNALAEQPETGFWLYGPEILRNYCGRHGVRADTAGTISVDHARSLSKELREAGSRVLRLGAGHGGGEARGQTAFQGEQIVDAVDGGQGDVKGTSAGSSSQRKRRPALVSSGDSGT